MYGDIVPEGFLENIMKRYKNEHRNSFFTCLKIRDITDKMFRIMQENFEGLVIADLSDPTLFEKILI